MGLKDWKNKAGIRLLASEISLKISKNRYKTLWNALKYDEKCIFFVQLAQMWMINSKIFTGKNRKRFRAWRNRKVIHNHSSTIERWKYLCTKLSTLSTFICYICLMDKLAYGKKYQYERNKQNIKLSCLFTLFVL